MTLWGTVTTLQTLPALGSDPVELAVDLGNDSVAQGVSLSEGIRMLYQKCQFYDLLLVAGGMRFPAHKAVLAALSTSFREHIRQATQSSSASSMVTEVQGFEEHPGKDAFHGENAEQMPATDLSACMLRCRERRYGAFVVWRGTAYFRSRCAKECLDGLQDSAECTVYVDQATAGHASPQPKEAAEAQHPARGTTELHLQDVASAEAVAALLDFAYELGSEYCVTSHEANKDVLRLAGRFDLPLLEQLAAEWLAKDLSSENVLERLAVCEEFGLATLYDLIIEQVTQSPHVLQLVSSNEEVMKYPKILRSLLVKAAEVHGTGASTGRSKGSEKRRKVLEDAAVPGGG